MTIWLQIILWLAAVAVGGWLFRFAGQKLTGNKPYFRDMPYGVAFGYVFGALVLVWLGGAYVTARTADAAVANKYFFLRIVIEGFILFSIAAWLFRLLAFKRFEFLCLGLFTD